MANAQNQANQSGQASNVTPASPNALDNKKEALKTYIEQTKLLITLASAFIIAPAVIFKDLANVNHATLIWMEVCFIGSVLSSYVVMGAITGTQHKGDYDVNRGAIRVWSFAQLILYVVGLIIFIGGLLTPSTVVSPATTVAKPDTIKTQTIINNNTFHDCIKRPAPHCHGT